MELLTLSLDDNSEKTLYHQLYTYIKTEIQRGSMKYNDRLPSKRKLASHLNISQNTVKTAYEQLIDEGYVISIERKGYFVAKIENLLIFDTQKKSMVNEEDLSDRNIKYDFSYQGVDRASFPFSIWKKVTREVINEYDTEILMGTKAQGDHKLRQSIASYLKQSRGVICNPDDIILSAGAEYLFYILFQLLNEDYTYGIENPGYEKLNLLFTNNRVDYIPIDIDKNGMILRKIEKSGANIICITPAHQFPTGVIMPINRRIQLLNWMNEKNNRYIIEDDYDSEFKYSGRPIPALKGLKNSDKVIYMGNFSKSLSPGIRVSYMVMPKELIARYREELPFMTCPVPTIQQKTLAKFMMEGYFARHLNKMRIIYRKKREILVNSLRKHEKKLKIIGADAGLHITIEVSNGMTEKELIKSAEDYGVKVYGFSRYYNSGKPETCRILLGYADMKEKEIEEGMEILYTAWL